jgi:leucyl aminopeptidase
MAQKEGGDMILDFATLTGACISSLGTAYSGVFSNRKDLLPALTESGVRSGERVWPFPMDEDFADCLESEIADLLQCRLSGGVDHIEAALFLKKFVGEEIPWVHFDLAAARNTGGLAHIDTPTTGVGVRVATKFLKGQFKL